jgi:hypothetical protein
MTHLEPDQLEALAFDELSEQQRSALEPHLAGCAACRDAVAEARAQRDAVQRWADAGDGRVDRLWSGVEARLHRSRLRRRLASGAAAVALAAAGFAVAFVRAPHPPLVAEEDDDGDELTRSAAAAIAAAESDYRRAIATLEARLPQSAGAGGSIARARRSLTLAHAAAAHEPRNRVRVLEGYATYTRSLRRALDEGPQDEP